MNQQKNKSKSSWRKRLGILKSNQSGDLSVLKPLEVLKQSQLAFMIGSGLFISTFLAIPTFAAYIDQLNQEPKVSSEMKVDEVIDAEEISLEEGMNDSVEESTLSETDITSEEESPSNTWWTWGLLLLVLVGGSATFQSLRKMDSVEESEEFFIGDDLEDDEELDDEFLDSEAEDIQLKTEEISSTND